MVGTSSTLHLIASNETAGRYYCKAHSSGFQEISSEALVILKGPPKIISRAQQHPIDSKTYEIDCTAISVPKAKHVSWAFNGILIDTDKDAGFSLRQDVLYDRIKSTLRIEENQSKYFGTYSCTVINKYGSDTLDIVFSERSEYCRGKKASVSTLALRLIEAMTKKTKTNNNNKNPFSN